ncbi:hypothetical protein HYH03_000614 [Edaphochlamys debaryana]|uniref:Uncharacterized protein n=1 Tax=Edaphochlamys debaryana TaxID=47281 RepID=A0A836C7D0_9CHLO|nr:hypothetical protein HYH03_000614 [Edaphochlamys debaryana]|eukprot:KAG2502123.1 hypothetical protein HYH03_000614 [Edaphochlamys debaryana]
MKALYAQDNQICTLKGSLLYFKFLETLDLSNNQLRDLEKQLKLLEKFKFIKELNLSGNPLCEEPDYRLLVIHRMPALKVLDQHVITDLERRKAAGLIGGDVATLTVAFGKRVPPYDPKWDEKVPERSVLEQDMTKEAATIRDNLRHEAYMRERGMFLHDPHPQPPRGHGLPPNAGTVRAMQTWRQQQAEQGLASASGDGGERSSSGSGAGGSGHGGPQQGRAGGLSPGLNRTGSPGQGTERYYPRDKLVLYSLRPGVDPLAATGGMLPPVSSQGPIKLEQAAYEQWLQTKAAGQGSWAAYKQEVQL